MYQLRGHMVNEKVLEDLAEAINKHQFNRVCQCKDCNFYNKSIKYHCSNSVVLDNISCIVTGDKHEFDIEEGNFVPNPDFGCTEWEQK